MPRCSSSRSAEGKTPGASMDTDRCAMECPLQVLHQELTVAVHGSFCLSLCLEWFTVCRDLPKVPCDTL